MIKKMTPSVIVVELSGRTATIDVEALLPGYGSPDFVIYENSVNAWDSPLESDNFTDKDRNDVIEQLKSDLFDRNITFEVEA